MFFKNKNKRPDPSSPMDLSYMKRVEFYLYLISAWPYDEMYDTYKKRPRKLRSLKIIFLTWVGITINGILYAKANLSKLGFLVIGHTYISILMSCITTQRIVVLFFKSYYETVADFVLNLHLFHHKHMSEYAMKVYEQVHRISTIFSICVFIQMYINYLTVTLTPVYKNLKSGVFKASVRDMGNETHYEHAVFYYYMFDSNNFGYSITFLFNCFVIFDCSIILCVYDLLITLMVFNVWGHLKILKYNLENFPRPEAEKDINSENSIIYTEDESRKVREMLKENILHHTMITQFMSRASAVFGPTMCFYYLFDQISICILLLKLSDMKMEAFTSYGVLTVVILQQLIQISVIFEMIGSKSETIRDAVYGLPWECMDVKNRKIVLFFLYNSQTPITLKALGMVSVGVQTMAAILKASVSYFIMLRTIADS